MFIDTNFLQGHFEQKINNGPFYTFSDKIWSPSTLQTNIDKIITENHEQYLLRNPY